MKCFLALISLCLFQYAYACPEFDGVDLANGDQEPEYRELSASSVELTADEFYSMPTWSDTRDYDAFQNCRGAMVVKKLQHQSTGRVFNALISVEDRCDGGNSVGALYTENLVMRVGDIGDSFISCYKL